ncbi:hypothetical protein CH35J_009901 [Colletotrichum higginsianum]|uniref:Uncharacterized protein n=1 Tax=Colletotrichum higginsianum TaxID=80884 RepID=A0A4T0VM48_9PEZI|nr:hypothetical protein CH35J_009901 [Colletotrichum higginsianum]
MGLSFNTSPTVIEGVAIAHLPQRINLSSALLSPKSLNYSDIVAFIIGALLSGLIYSVIYNLYLSPIATVPGPLTAKLSPLWLMRATIWNIVSDLSFGEPLLEDQLGKFERLKTAFCMASPLLEALQVLLAVPGAQTLVQVWVGIVPLLFWLPTNILPSSTLRKRYERQDKNEDFLTAIMRCRELGIRLTDKELQSNASLLVMVGYDTTATSLSATMNFC